MSLCETVPAFAGIPFSFNTCKDVMRQLRQVFKWAHKRGHIPVDLSDAVPMPSGTPPPKQPIDLSALAAMLTAAQQT